MGDLRLVSYSTGSMNSLVDKLASMKNHSGATKEFCDLTEKFKKVVKDLKVDFCEKLSVPKVCMKQVRELFFEIEDWIDQKPETNMLDPSDTENIDYFMSEIDKARGRRTWYLHLLEEVLGEPDLDVVGPSNININPRLLVEEKSCHDLLDGPRDELVQYLTDDDKEEMRKVASVVGMEGLGKTTLAKEIYSELQLRGRFQCHAFVSVGRRPAMREILQDILHQVKPTESSTSLDMQQVITELREYLDTKRYFIVVDGIWSTWAWKVINCALPTNNPGSRVLTTTCSMDVGRLCCSYPNDHVYQMEALSKENSRKLFLSRITNLQEVEKGVDFKEASGCMLNMCGGMPLAIIVAAGLLLARKSGELAELKTLGKSIDSSLKQYSTSDGMTKILHMSYADLSLPLRSCFLYLGVFLGNYTIKKDHLIWLWGAEGFIPKRDKECLWATGEMYFNELISRRLIQPVFNFDDDQAVGCTVHTVILDFIRSISREENFATRATELNSGPFPCDTIRRFSLDCGNEDEADTLSTNSVHLSNMRSLRVFGDVHAMPTVSEDDEEKHAPPAIRVSSILLNFKLMRVLDLENTKNLQDHHLEGIGGLVLLRYLGLGRTGITRLPEDIGELEQLETLDLMPNSGRSMLLPASVVKLQKLTHLLLEVDARKIWEMPELQVASGIRVESSSSLGTVVELLSKSKGLRMLGVSLEGSVPTKNDLLSFHDEVVKSNLQSLSLYWNYYRDDAITNLLGSWGKVTASQGKKFEPRRFELKIRDTSYLKQVPPNMDSLASLTHLHIMLHRAEAEDFLVLGGLTNLVLLNLSTFDCRITGRFIIREGIFLCLKVFSFKIRDRWISLEFKKGAMPQLQRLGRSIKASMPGDQEYLDIGIEHLTFLTRVHATINCQNATVSEVEDAEASIRAKVSEIATKPTLELSRENEEDMTKVEQGVKGQRLLA